MAKEQIDWEDIGQRTIALNSLGGYILHADGHRYLFWADQIHHDDMHTICREHKIEVVRSKQYGGIKSILDQVDEMLAKLKYGSLREIYKGLAEMRQPEDLILEPRFP